MLMLDWNYYKEVSEQVLKSDKRLLFFDYDGTLMPLVKFPSLSAPNEDVIRVLSRLTSDKKIMWLSSAAGIAIQLANGWET